MVLGSTTSLTFAISVSLSASFPASAKQANAGIENITIIAQHAKIRDICVTRQEGVLPAGCAGLEDRIAPILLFYSGTASLGMRQSPRGERLIEPTFGPSGMQLRLNCCW